MFYHDNKPHMSPSALQQWLKGRGQFVKSYFAGEKGPTTKAMEGGTTIHALVEAGIIKAKKVYAYNESELKVAVPHTDFYFLGKPDSYELAAGSAHFVDYKSGKANGWDEKLPVDIKMRATAWLIWQKCGMPKKVYGAIEFIQTTWDPNTKSVVPIDGKETEVVEIVYTYDELDQFTKVIAQAMRDVNAFYEKWKESTGDFVNKDDVARYVELKNEIAEKETEMDEIGERIKSQMEFGGEENHKTSFGSFFFKRSKTYEIPKDLQFTVEGEEDPYTLERAEKVGAGAKAAKSNYELANEPKETTTSLNFRAAKEK